MIERKDILSIPYLKKSVFAGSYEGMRYRLEKVKEEETEKEQLKVVIWPGPYSFNVSKEEKTETYFSFSEEGICLAVEWLNNCWQERKEEWKNAQSNW